MAVVATIDRTLNGGSVSVTVFEDTDQDGTAENQDTFTASLSGSYAVDLEGGAGNDYWIRFDLDISSEVESSPTVNSISLDTEPTADLSIACSLNGNSATATVFEDSNADGTADAQEQITLSDGANTYSLSSLSPVDGNDYWIQFDLTGGVESSPEIHSARLVTASEAIISAQAATIQISGPDASLSAGASSIQADEGVITLAAPNGSVSPGDVSIQAPAATLDVAGQDATVVPGESIISADEATLQITAENAGRVFDSAQLAGTVTLNGSGVEGAAVYAIDDLQSFGGVDSTNTEVFEGVATLTESNGDYSIRVDAGNVYHLAYQYEDDQGNQYNSLSKPFLVPG